MKPATNSDSVFLIGAIDLLWIKLFCSFGKMWVLISVLEIRGQELDIPIPDHDLLKWENEIFPFLSGIPPFHQALAVWSHHAAAYPVTVLCSLDSEPEQSWLNPGCHSCCSPVDQSWSLWPREEGTRYGLRKQEEGFSLPFALSHPCGDSGCPTPDQRNCICLP